MNKSQKEIKLGNVPLPSSRHMCAFFYSVDDQYKSLGSFIKEGIDDGEKAVHVIDAQCRHEHYNRLEKLGINVAESERKGQLEVRGWENAYLRENKFDQYKMLQLIEEVLGKAKTDGFPLTRLVANMEWALSDLPGVHDIVEYETRLNYILPKYDDPVICTYDLNRFSAPVVMDILRTHPVVIVGGIASENPYYVSPDVLLKELKERN